MTPTCGDRERDRITTCGVRLRAHPARTRAHPERHAQKVPMPAFWRLNAPERPIVHAWRRGPETAAAAVTGQVGERGTHSMCAPTRAFGNDKRLPGAQDVACPVDRYGSRAGDADQQHVDLGIHVLRHALARSENQQVDIEILALLRPDRSRSSRSAGQRGKVRRSVPDRCSASDSDKPARPFVSISTSVVSSSKRCAQQGGSPPYSSSSVTKFASSPHEAWLPQAWHR